MIRRSPRATPAASPRATPSRPRTTPPSTQRPVRIAAIADGPGPVGGPGGAAAELDARVSELNASYSSKLKAFMSERAQERLQSQRRVAQLEERLGGFGRALLQPAGADAAAARPPATPEPGTPSSYSQRLAQLASERADEERRHQEEVSRYATELGRLRTQLRAGDGGAVGAAAAAPTAPAAEHGEWSRQQRRMGELQKHIGVLQAGGVTTELGRRRLGRLQDELHALRAAAMRGTENADNSGTPPPHPPGVAWGAPPPSTPACTNGCAAAAAPATAPGASAERAAACIARGTTEADRGGERDGGARG